MVWRCWLLKGVSEPCLKVRERELTFDVLILPAGCGTAMLWMENKVGRGDYRYNTWLGFVFGRSRGMGEGLSWWLQFLAQGHIGMVYY